MGNCAVGFAFFVGDFVGAVKWIQGDGKVFVGPGGCFTWNDGDFVERLRSVAGDCVEYRTG